MIIVDALIGHSGFVGGTLALQHNFAAKFNTSNIDLISDQAFDVVVCAAAPGSMFMANQEPERDKAQIEALIERLHGLRTERFVLISTIAVLADFASGEDEATEAFQQNLAYGRHRRLLESFCENRFSNCTVIRLPALFGPGLRKNFIFDLLNPAPTMLNRSRFEMLLERVPAAHRDLLCRLYTSDPSGMYVIDRHALNRLGDRLQLEEVIQSAELSAIQFHHPDTTYQYYNLSRLWRDISLAIDFDLECVHLATEPLRAGDIHARLLGHDMQKNDARLHHEDMHTRHAPLWGREGPYLESASQVLDSLEIFFASQRRAK